jgi:hypothetical protein
MILEIFGLECGAMAASTETCPGSASLEQRPYAAPAVVFAAVSDGWFKWWILITCIVDAMSDLDADFKDRFVKNLDRSYAKIRDDNDDLNALELLSWTRTPVTGFDFSGGPQRPFLD